MKAKEFLKTKKVFYGDAGFAADGEFGEDRVAEAMEEFHQQALQQTPCSTLRELLVQKMNSVTEERKELSYNSITDIEKAQEIETINWVLSLIDASQPVA